MFLRESNAVNPSYRTACLHGNLRVSPIVIVCHTQDRFKVVYIASVPKPKGFGEVGLAGAAPQRITQTSALA